jgi:uncharacterized protein YbjT (DUF2867 family)
MKDNKVLVFGATGNIGGAAIRVLLGRGWQVRAVTRNPKGSKVESLARLGAEVVKGEMEDRTSLENVFDGIQRVFSVQNWTTSGAEGELRQGKLVAEVAHAAGVEHLVYGSAGNGDRHTGIPHFDSKVEVENHMRSLGLPFTVVRPTPFMELLINKQFYPALSTWGAEPRVIGWETPIPWVAVADIGMAIANVIENPGNWIGREINLAGDVKTLAECREIFIKINGKKPLGLPLPPGLFSKIAGEEFIQMWVWLRELVADHGSQYLWEMVDASKEVVPEMLEMETWLRRTRKKVSQELQVA